MAGGNKSNSPKVKKRVSQSAEQERKRQALKRKQRQQ